MIRRMAAIGAVAVVAALAVSAPATLARLTDSAQVAATLGTATLRPPTAVTGTGGTSASLAWTASTSTAATGYQLLRSATSGSGYAAVKTITPVSATATTDSPGAGVWYYVLDTSAGSWTSAHSNEAGVTIASASTTTSADCASQAPETVNAGDNNGYETNPQYGCGLDGRVATDANSGTSTSTSCSNSGKDRHRFWGYALGLPGAVTSVNGIRVQLVAAISSTSGTNVLCAQLSWDGGTSWTSAKSVALTSTALTTYQLGASTDTWGHAWTPAQLGSSTFRVRITDVSSSTGRTFTLDQLAAAVTYTP